MKRFLKIEEVAELLAMDYKTVYRLVLGGLLPAVKIGAVYRIQQEDLDRFIESQRLLVGGEGGGASVATAASCARCGLAFRVPSLVAGKCQEPGCDAPLCTNCWDEEADRFCSDHARPERVKTIERARELYRRGESPIFLEADAARQQELTFISRFDQAVRRLSGVTSPWEGNWVPVKSWVALSREEPALLPAEGVMVVRYGRGRRPLPRNMTSFYYVSPGAGKKTSFAIGAAFFSHLAAYLNQSFDTAPATRGELLDIVDHALALVRSRDTRFVIGLASPTGWEPEAGEFVLGSATVSGFIHADLVLVLVDLYRKALKFNPADLRIGPLADLFLGELEEETLQRIVSAIRQALLLRESLSLAEAVKIAQAPEGVVLKALARLQAEGGYVVEWLKGLGNVISKV